MNIKKVFLIMIISTFFTLCLGKPYLASAEHPPTKTDTLRWDWPVSGIMTDHFGSRGGAHFGIDIAAEQGTAIHAVGKGTVHKSYLSRTYGHVIFIQHPEGFETVYAHLSKRLVEEGDEIYVGQIIGLVGNTGKSDGNHLHFEVHEDAWNIEKSNAVDPLVFLDEESHAVEVMNVQPTDNKIVSIQKGDTLWGLSNSYGVSVEELKKWNNLSSDLIIVGNSLIVFKEKT